MKNLKVKVELERSLHRKISGPEWRHLERKEFVSMFERNSLDWREFRECAREEFECLRSLREDEARERLGVAVDEYPGDRIGYQQEGLPADPEDRVSARMGAIGARNILRAKESAPPRAAMHSTLLPRGGVDGTLPQLVYITAVELWMPAEEVMKAYRRMQQTLMAETEQPKTQARAYNVARFVWEQEKHYGQRPPWPVLCERWNNYPLTRPFENWRDFRTNFLRGAKATLPRYIATDEQLTEQVRREACDGVRAFRSWTDQVLAATVQQPERIT